MSAERAAHDYIERFLKKREAPETNALPLPTGRSQPRLGETEVFFNRPEEGKCYEHAEATRKEWIDGRRRYFTTNMPKYVGKFVKQTHSGTSDGIEVHSYFKDSRTGETHEIAHSYEGNTCFREVPCRWALTRSRNGTRKLNVSPAPPNSVSAPPNSVSAPNKPGFNARSTIEDDEEEEYPVRGGKSKRHSIKHHKSHKKTRKHRRGKR